MSGNHRPHCGCCASLDAVTPNRLDNPPGLPAITYRAGRHGEFLETLQARLQEERVLARQEQAADLRAAPKDRSRVPPSRAHHLDHSLAVVGLFNGPDQGLARVSGALNPDDDASLGLVTHQALLGWLPTPSVGQRRRS